MVVDANGMPRKALRCVRPRGGEGGVQALASEYACVPEMCVRATWCCAGAQPSACGIAELEYGNALDLE
eukprot:4945739-Pleurochrysis_carterae.AAC.1